MGGAVFIALDGEANFAALPERVETALRGALPERAAAAIMRKSDKLPPSGEANAARQVIRISTNVRAGDREMVRVRPYRARRLEPLALALRTLRRTCRSSIRRACSWTTAAAMRSPADDTPGAEPDAEVSFVTRDLASVLPRVKVAAAVPLEDVIARVRDAAEWTGSVARPMTASLTPTIPSSSRLNYAPDGVEADPYAGFEARIVPENITMLPKTAEAERRPERLERAAGRGEEKRIGGHDPARSGRCARRHPKPITAVLGARGRDGGLREGQKLRILFAPDAGRLRVVRVIVAGDAVEAVVALSDTGKYVAVDVQSMATSDRSRRSRRRRRERHTRRCGSIRASTKPRCAIRSRAR